MKKIKTEKLRKAIKTLLPATSKKELILQMAHLVFREEEIWAFNDKLCVSYPLKTGINASIPAEDLSKILSGITEDEVSFSINGSNVILTTDTTKATISIELESRIVEDFFNTIDFSSFKWKKLPEDFLDKLTLARFSVSSNMLDANNLFCIYVSGSNIFSGDDYRLSVLEMNGKMDNILIPGAAANDLVSFDGVESYALSAGWLYLRTDKGVIVSCRTIQGNYPDFLPYFDNFEGTSEITLERNIIPVLQNLSPLVEGESSFMKAVNISIGKNITTITGKKEGLNVEKTVPNSYGGETVNFNVSPVFLAYILDITTSVSIGENSAMFEGEGFYHIVQLPVE